MVGCSVVLWVLEWEVEWEVEWLLDEEEWEVEWLPVEVREDEWVVDGSVEVAEVLGAAVEVML